jgi:tetratricopeptide (TPR) repeat protein
MSRTFVTSIVVAGLLSACLHAQPNDTQLLARYQQANDLRAAGKYEQAEKLYRQLLADVPRTVGEDSPFHADVLNGLGLTLSETGRPELAEPAYLRALTIRENKLGKDHLDVAVVLNNLAALYRETGRYEQAEPAYRRALDIRVARLGNDHPTVAISLNNFGLFLRDIGRLDVAELLLRRALEIRETRLGKDHVSVAGTLTNLGELLAETGRHEQAEAAYQRALTIKETALGKDHPSVAVTLNNLAVLLASTGRLEQAERHYRRALQIERASLGDEHPRVATTLNNLGRLLHDLGRFNDAEQLFGRCLEIRIARLGKDHPQVVSVLNNLALLYQHTGKLDLAERMYRRGVEITEASLGKDHPNLLPVLSNLGEIEVLAGRLDRAADTFDRGRRLSQRYALGLLPMLGERDQLAFLTRTDVGRLHSALSLALAHPDEADLTARSAEWLFNAKGLAQQARALALRAGRQGRLAKDFQTLLDLRRRLAHLALAGPAPGQEAEYRKALAELTEKEQALSRQLQVQGAGAVPPWTESKDVRAALPADAVLVDFARFDRHDHARNRLDPPRYAAWITPKNGPTRLIDLGEAQAIDDAIGEARKALEGAPRVLKAVGEIAAEKRAREPLARLAKLVLDPLRPHIDGAKRWVLCPDGKLWLVPWAALPLDEKTYAVEKHTLQLTISGRDLLPRPRVGGRTSGPAIFADPDYDSPVPVPPAETRGLSQQMTFGRVPRLPGAAIEADAIADKIAKVFGTAPSVFTEGRATTSAFLALERPKALTLSTHGFFLPDQEPDAREKERLQRDPNARPAKFIEDPLLRCGLLLAGCNKPGDAGRAGVLTGREVLSADLRGCELVVLSACQTGLGEVRNGEGVAGLRQAFQLAGAESVLASLWKVPDDETTLQMVALMDALARGGDRVEALAEAQRQRITQRREKFGAAHPFNWAAFTLTGR